MSDGIQVSKKALEQIKNALSVYSIMKAHLEEDKELVSEKFYADHMDMLSFVIPKCESICAYIDLANEANTLPASILTGTETTKLCKEFVEKKMGCKLTDEDYLAILEAQKANLGHLGLESNKTKRKG